MLKKISIFILIFLFIIFVIFFLPKDNSFSVREVISPVEMILDNGNKFSLKEFDSFDDFFSDKNKFLAEKYNLSEEEAFIIGNLAKYWAKNILEGRDVYIQGDELIYSKFVYNKKFFNSAFCLKDNEITNKYAFDKLVNSVRKSKYGIVSDGVYYPVSKDFAKKDFILMKKSHYYVIYPKKKKQKYKKLFKPYIYFDNIKLIVSDSISKQKPDRGCSAEICKEILYQINNSKSSIDIAIYGYSSTPLIEKALIDAIKRGVNVRLVYDVDSSNKNIYPDTFKFVNMISANNSDKNSKNVSNIMHNKFYIFDNKLVITGSANLSHTDMSGFNTNNVVVINSTDVANIYKKEFEQMYNGKFHQEKLTLNQKQSENLKIYFSPQDKPILQGVVPLIKNAKNYIYVPTFFITEKHLIQELINAKNRGVDVRIIVDAVSASNKYSAHKTLRNNGILVKTENFAGKMHAKTIIIDDEYLILGSMNFTNSGENKNDENMLIIKNKKAAKYMKSFFLYQWGNIPEKWLKYTARAEGKDSPGSCFDGIDNNYDGLIDSKDEACKP